MSQKKSDTAPSTPSKPAPSLLPPGKSYSDERTQHVLSAFTQSALRSVSMGGTTAQRFSREYCPVQFSESPAYYSGVTNPAFVISNWSSSSQGYRSGGLH